MAKTPKNRVAAEARAAMRRAGRAEYLAALADGRLTRAATYADRRAVQSKRACRGNIR